MSRPALLVTLVALAQYFWNLSSMLPFTGYDGVGHMQYVATLIDEGRLPHPLEGWSTFHPPLYYLLVAALSWPTRPEWRPLLIEGLSAVAILVTALVGHRLLRRGGAGEGLTTVTVALLLFVPCVQLAATMVGNEALGTAFCALALPLLLRLQAEPRQPAIAGLAGLMAGLALATKFTGLFVAVACVVPFCRRSFDRRCLGALLACALVGAAVAGPVYVRNLQLTGSAVPMTRDRDPVATVERQLTVRERRWWDYVWVNPAVLARPVVQLPSEDVRSKTLNPDMTNVPGLAYASLWYDPHSQRVPVRLQAKALKLGRVLLLLGIVPTLAVLGGLLLALRDLLQRRSEAPDAPLTVMTLIALLTFLVFTLRAPTTAAVKASYLLPLIVPAALFFARFAHHVRERARSWLLALSAVAAFASALTFTNGVVVPIQRPVPNAAATKLSADVVRLAAHFERARMGRWVAVDPAPLPDGWLAWNLTPHDFPAFSDRAAAVWCRYVAEGMEATLPGRRWIALISQFTEDRHRSCTYRTYARPDPFLE